METFDKKQLTVFQVGDKVLLTHLPRQSGEEMTFPATVRQVFDGYYLIDTDYQKGIKVKVKDLRLF